MISLMTVSRGGSRAAAISKIEHFVIIVTGFQPLTITKRSVLDVAAALDLPLVSINRNIMSHFLIVTTYKVHKDKLFNLLENTLLRIFCH